jgi:hypothetical protein
VSTIDFGDRPGATDALAEAARLFVDAGDRSDLKLEAILRSLGAALDLLRDDHEWSETAPLQYLFAGLSRLAAGRPDPVLRPLREDKKAGKSAILGGAMIFKQVIILLAHEVLRRGGWRKTAADRRVAELATAAGFTSLEGKPISSDMVRGWRSLISTPEMRAVEFQLSEQTSMLKDKLDPSYVVQAAEEMLNHSVSSFAGIELSRKPTLP